MTISREKKRNTNYTEIKTSYFRCLLLLFPLCLVLLLHEMSLRSVQCCCVFLVAALSSVVAVGAATDRHAPPPAVERWAVIASTSRFWHNYRHTANALSLYHVLRARDTPDDRILLWLADHHSCDCRNYLPATLYNDMAHHVNLNRKDLLADYSGYAVSVNAFLSTLQGFVAPATPFSQQLRSGSTTDLFIYLTGHGGDGFLKFQDAEALAAEDLAAALERMYAQGRYRRALVLIETCQGESLCLGITAPNVVCISSARIGEDSLSHHGDPAIGVHVIDRFTYETLAFFEALQRMPLAQRRAVTLRRLFAHYTHERLLSTATFRATNESALDGWLVSDFFGGGDGEADASARAATKRDSGVFVAESGAAAALFG